ncbi:glycoside hydrolase family 16 protein [Streptomyces sp. NPDC102441]|uniref:glycoside hydrolase family 16 protein n=1 Tax=Streptomyces sp. NPDC102441 TaxID=3366176 RepID=UPI003820473C
MNRIASFGRSQGISPGPGHHTRRRLPATLAALALCLPLAGLMGVTGPAGLSGGTASAAEPAAQARTAAADWTTMFRDDFDGASGTGLDTANWLYDIGTSYPGGAANWGTGEIETSTDSTDNVYQDGSGHLAIKPIRDDSGHWTSGRVETQRTDFAAPEGGQMRLSASLKQPDPESGLGYWPAFWAMGADARPTGATNWPSIGELDIMEDVNALSQHSTTFHCGEWAGECHDPDGISSDLQACDGCQSDYHTYSVIVDRRDTAAEQLRFYLDDVQTFAVNQSEVSDATWKAAVDHGFFAIFDVAIGGSYPDKVCGCTSPGADITSGAEMSVDWFAAEVSQS